MTDIKLTCINCKKTNHVLTENDELFVLPINESTGTAWLEKVVPISGEKCYVCSFQCAIELDNRYDNIIVED